MTHLGFQYDERKKSFFTDRHESEETCEHRKKFIKEYLEYELYSHLWIQLSKDDARVLEKKEELLQNI